MKRFLPFVTMCLALFAGGCTLTTISTDRITVVVRPCVMRGSASVPDKNDAPISGPTQAAVDNMVSAAFDGDSEHPGVNQIWEPGADIAFLAEVNRGGDVPIIDDPDKSVGHIGDVAQDEGATTSGESQAAIDECNNAWVDQFTDGSMPGIPVIFVASLIAEGTTTRQEGDQGGFTTPTLADNVAVDGPAKACAQPYTFPSSFATGRATLIETISTHGPVYLVETIAHELGHELMLAHGDGQDNDNNGPWDQRCDFSEYQTFDLNDPIDQRSLMDPAPSTETTITPLQRALARHTAVMLPGTVGGPP